MMQVNKNGIPTNVSPKKISKLKTKKLVLKTILTKYGWEMREVYE